MRRKGKKKGGNLCVAGKEEEHFRRGEGGRGREGKRSASMAARLFEEKNPAKIPGEDERGRG